MPIKSLPYLIKTTLSLSTTTLRQSGIVTNVIKNEKPVFYPFPERQRIFVCSSHSLKGVLFGWLVS